MPQGRAPFSAAEYDRRVAKTRAAMKAAGIDVLCVSAPSNQAWLTGYDGWSFYAHQGVILGLDGAPAWWGLWRGAGLGLETTETILIRETGPAEALCNVPRKMFVKD